MKAIVFSICMIISQILAAGVDVPQNVKAAAVSECVQSAAVAGAIASEAINERHDSHEKFIATINKQFSTDDQTRNWILQIGDLVYAQPAADLKNPAQFARKFRQTCLASMKAQFERQFGTPVEAGK